MNYNDKVLDVIDEVKKVVEKEPADEQKPDFEKETAEDVKPEEEQKPDFEKETVEEKKPRKGKAKEQE